MVSEWFKRFTEVMVPWIGVAALVFSAGYAIFEYRSHINAMKVQRSLDLVRRLNSELLEDRVSIDVAWSNKYRDLRALRAENSESDDSEKVRSYFEFVNSFIDQNEFQPSVMRLMYFLEELSICIEVGLCSENAALSHIGRFANIFYVRHHPYICKLRALSGDPTIGIRIQDIIYRQGSDRDVC